MYNFYYKRIWKNGRTFSFPPSGHDDGGKENEVEQSKEMTSVGSLHI